MHWRLQSLVFSLFLMAHFMAARHITTRHREEIYLSREIRQSQPQVYSGPFPCLDKNGAPQFPPPNGAPWPTDDKCHLSICTGAGVLTKSIGCMLKGAACPPGTYLEVPPKPQSPLDCCMCKPYQMLNKRGHPADDLYVRPVFDPRVQHHAMDLLRTIYAQ
ncbi:predicted protein [Nematostella vectensis]|uniref:Single domain-containing protein n=1 Tax=Nematostella vectensis TaxID=45351 RepID=A7SFC5_NEMVE|nr:uncharacterized protein LOC5509127 isoform X2 [Nematostella vectensis]EDO37600.1 predicted protein [Nematostella vectensis]|eukprot:XP_001629663.1 predicted protein [Nematostella vectensis]